MRLVEAVSGELRHQIEDLLDLLRRIAPLHRAVDEALALLRHLLGFLLAHGAAQQVGFAERVAGQPVGDLHHLFLVDDDAQRFLQDFLQFRKFVFDLLAAVLAIDEVVDHAALNRAGTVERVQSGEIFDGIRLVAAQHVAHAVRFKLEHAGGQAVVKDLLVGLLVVERNAFEIDAARPRVCSISLSASSRMVSVVRPRKSIFSRPIFSMATMSKAVTISSFLVRYSGTSSVSGRGEITTPAACTPALRTRPSSFLRSVDQLADLRVAFVRLLQRRRFLERVFQLDVQRGRDHLGDAVHIGVRHVHGAAHVFDRGLGRHGAEGDDLRHVLAAVLAGDVVDDFAAPVHAEIDVDIRHAKRARDSGSARRAVVLQRIDIGDPKRIGDQRTRRRTAARAHRNVVLPRVADEVPDDQEVSGKLHLLDDGDFPRQPLLVFARALCFSRPCCSAVAQRLQPPRKSFARDMLEIAVERVAVRHVEVRKRIADFLQLHVAAFRDVQRAREHVRRVFEDRATSRRGS